MNDESAVMVPEAPAYPGDAPVDRAIGRAGRDAPDHVAKVPHAHGPPGIRGEEIEKAVLRRRERDEPLPDSHTLVEAELEALEPFGPRERDLAAEPPQQRRRPNGELVG